MFFLGICWFRFSFCICHVAYHKAVSSQCVGMCQYPTSSPSNLIMCEIHYFFFTKYDEIAEIAMSTQLNSYIYPPSQIFGASKNIIIPRTQKEIIFLLS